MTPIAWMLAVGVGLWTVVQGLGGAAVRPEAAYALASPLACAVGSWLVIARVHAWDPSRVTGVLLAGFGVKALVFGAFVAFALRGLGLRPMPFVLSFSGFFIALYAVEAFFLRRMFAGDVRSVSRE